MTSLYRREKTEEKTTLKGVNFTLFTFPRVFVVGCGGLPKASARQTRRRDRISRAP
jgi:hypothetical protein